MIVPSRRLEPGALDQHERAAAMRRGLVENRRANTDGACEASNYVAPAVPGCTSSGLSRFSCSTEFRVPGADRPPAPRRPAIRAGVEAAQALGATGARYCIGSHFWQVNWLTSMYPMRKHLSAAGEIMYTAVQNFSLQRDGWPLLACNAADQKVGFRRAAATIELW